MMAPGKSKCAVASRAMVFTLALLAALFVAAVAVPMVPATAEAAVSDEDIEAYYESYSLKGFIEWMLERDDLTDSQVADLENAYSMLEGYIDSGEIDITDSDDAASLENFAHSLEILATIEELRESDEYYNQLYTMTDLYTNFTMMVGSAYTANVSIYEVAHVSSYGTFASNENLAWGYTDPTAGWYTEEKEYIDQAMEDLGYSVETLTTTQWSAVLSAAASYGTIGHYTNLFYGVSSGYDTLMGVGYTTESYLYSRTASSNAARATRYSSYYAYTASELQAYLAEYEAYLLEDLTDGWTAWGTCEWMIDDDGVLMIRPMGNGTIGVVPVCTSSSDIPWYDVRESITKVVIEGTVAANEYLRYLFGGCSSLSAIEGLDNLDVSHVISLSQIFFNCSSLSSLDLSGWDTASLENASYMFYGCSSLEALDVSGWDTSQVTTMASMFYGCSLLTSLDLSTWDVSGVTSMLSVFYGCTSLTALDVSGWDTSSATNMQALFYGCSSLEALDVSGWDTASLKNASYLFYGCSSLGALDVSGWDTSQVTTMASMFYGCSLLISLDLSTWDTSSVTSMQALFYGCSSLEALDVSGWDTSSVTTTYRMFYNCSSLVSLDLSDWDTSNVTNSSAMFYNCTGLRTLVLGESFTLTSRLVLPEDSTYGTGVWVSDGGAVYSTASSIPSSTAATYCAIFPSASFGLVTVSADGCAGVSLTASVALDEDVAGIEFVELSYQWYDAGGNAVSSGTSATLAIDDELLGGTYYCVVSDASGVYTSTLTSASLEAVHSFGEWTVMTEATCEEEGVETRTCSACEATETQAIAATGHSYVGVATDPTCTEAGYTTYTCSACGDSYVVEGEAAAGHSYESAATTEPTCTAEGVLTYTCSACGNSYTEAIAATGEHTWGEWMVTTEAAVGVEGEQARTCSVCGAVETETIAALVSIADAVVEVDLVLYQAGEADEPAVTVTVSSDGEQVVLEESVDYTVTLVEDSEAGVLWVYVTGIGAYGGESVTSYGLVTSDDGEGDEGSDDDEDVSYDYFDDVTDSSKYWYEAVYQVAHLGYMTGKSSTHFGASDALTRAQMVTIVWRIACPEEAASYANDAVNETGMDDVLDNKYYTAAVNWAVAEGVITGKKAADGTSYFDPNGACTFEQFCTILARYLAGGDDALEAAVTSEEAEGVLSSFSDASSVSAYARKAVAYVVSGGAVDGKADGTLAPKETVARYRCVTVIYKAVVAGLL